MTSRKERLAGRERLRKNAIIEKEIAAFADLSLPPQLELDKMAAGSCCHLTPPPLIVEELTRIASDTKGARSGLERLNEDVLFDPSHKCRQTKELKIIKNSYRSVASRLEADVSDFRRLALSSGFPLWSRAWSTSDFWESVRRPMSEISLDISLARELLGGMTDPASAAFFVSLMEGYRLELDALQDIDMHIDCSLFMFSRRVSYLAVNSRGVLKNIQARKAQAEPLASTN